ncbi:hypothetical protein AB9F47_27445 [Rhizobium leguminosarum]|uniref:hypothetical protein n=1 Tax=Rhizobium leguminosarum TaxID=384 RepID=UPI003F9D41B2
MLGETISFIRRNLSFVCFFVAISCAIVIFAEYSDRSGGGSTQYFVVLYFGYCVQNTILNGTGGVLQINRGMVGFGSYLWKNLLILLVVMGIGIGVPLAFGAASFSTGVFLLLCGGLLAIIYPLLLALVGTWPTAGIAGSTSGLADAFARGRHGFVPTFLRLFAGIVFPAVTSFLLIVMAASMSYEADAVFQGGKLNLIALGLLIVSKCLETLGICYASIVLARKFQISEAARPSTGGGFQGTISATSDISKIFQ